MHAGYGIELHRTKVLRRHPRTDSWSVALGLQTAELRWERSYRRQVASCCTRKVFDPGLRWGLRLYSCVADAQQTSVRTEWVEVRIR